MSKRYWIYEHNAGGDIDGVEFFEDTLDKALFDVGIMLTQGDDAVDPTHSFHIVDQEKDSTTIWVAGACTLGNDHT